LPVQQLQQLTVEELHAIRSDLEVLDVRDQNEWDKGHIKGARLIPYYFREQHLQNEHQAGFTKTLPSF
jgi:rhodanese-related sulfurtransferase